MVVIIDYGMGNLRSVEKAALLFYKDIKVSDSIAVIKHAEKIIFPGVGHFGKAVKELKKRKIFSVLKEKIKEGIPFLGICLGMQLLFEESEEAQGVRGLAVFDGKVKKFRINKLIVPHMGWNRITRSRQQAAGKNNKLLKGIKDNNFFYFAHSYYCEPKNKEIILTTTDYGIEFPSSIYRNNIWAAQFHPEKSQKFGLRMIKNFLAKG